MLASPAPPAPYMTVENDRAKAGTASRTRQPVRTREKAASSMAQMTMWEASIRPSQNG